METHLLVYSNNFLNTTFHSPVWTLTGRQAISRAIASKIMVTVHHMMDLHHMVDMLYMVTFHHFESVMVRYLHHMVTFHHFAKMIGLHHMMDLHHMMTFHHFEETNGVIPPYDGTTPY